MGHVKVQLGDRQIHTNEGTEIGSIFRKAGLKDKNIVAATLNQGLVSLHTQIQGPCTLEPITTEHPIGRTVRRRTVSHMLQTMVSGRGDGLQLVIGQSIAGGYYYEVSNPADVDLETLAAELTGGIHHLAKAGIGFSYATVSVDGARRLLTDPSGSKAALLETWPSPMLVVVRLGQFVDIPHGPYAPDTSYGEGATVLPFQDGILLDFGDNGTMPPRERSQKLFACYRRTAEWNRNLNVDTIGKLNQTILKEQEEDIIRIAEALHEKRIANIADEIANRPQTHIVCIAGPSSSGKTTFMRRLSDQLRVNGMKPHLLSLDDYYRDREKCPIDPINGRFDFESPEALDIPLLHEHFEHIIRGKSFELPHFDFTTGRSRPSGRHIHRQKNEIVIVEGIHGNNPDLTGPLPEASRYRIFVNALNQLRIDDHNRILTSDTRLMRRIVRDRLYRGTSAHDTILQWNSVLNGEKRYIYPYQDHTDTIFNTALVYEASVLKTYAQRFLLEVPRNSKARPIAYRLLRFLDLFVPILPNSIPMNSILREFIGGARL